MKKKEKINDNQVAVALGYNEQTMTAPQVVAGGRGYIADKILGLAAEYNIPVRKDPVLVEALAQLDPGQEIPPELYQVIAEVLVFIMETDRRAAQKEALINK